MPYYGTDNDDYVNGEGFCCQSKVLRAGAIGNGNDNPELFQYYYHADHLGSSSLITNLDGEIVQHVEYVPFGEVFIKERNNTWNTPYLFNAKELDEETGLYYYGARYYDPRISLWLSTDPLQEKYPNISTYAYCIQNPVNAIDPDGRKVIFIVKIKGKITHYEYTLQGNLRNIKTGKTHSGKNVGGHLGKIVDGYNKMLNSGNENYIKQIKTLIKSDNTHHIDATEISGNKVTAGSKGESIDKSLIKASKGEGVGSYTTYDFSSDKLENGLRKTNYTTVTHEVQHQYDYDQGNLKDSFDKNGKMIKGADSPAEQRAMKNEDFARDQEKLERRIKF